MIQPLPPQADHFATLGVERRFELDRPTLDQRHRDVSRLVHPDRFATAPPQERRLSLLWATALNDAYKVLRDPWSRAEYLARLRGCDVGDEKAGGPRVSPAFLMDTLEMREALAAARAARDTVGIERMRADIETRRSALLTETATLLAAPATGEPAVPPRLGQALAENRFYARFLAEIDAFEEQEHAR